MSFLTNSWRSILFSIQKYNIHARMKVFLRFFITNYFNLIPKSNEKEYLFINYFEFVSGCLHSTGNGTKAEPLGKAAKVSER